MLSIFLVLLGNKDDISDFLAVDLDNGQLRISVSQGERKVFQKTLQSVHSTLADGVFHHVRVYKREKVTQIFSSQYKNLGFQWYDSYTMQIP